MFYLQSTRRGGGIAQALDLAEQFVGLDQIVVILGDNYLKITFHLLCIISEIRSQVRKF